MSSPFSQIASAKTLNQRGPQLPLGRYRVKVESLETIVQTKGSTPAAIWNYEVEQVLEGGTKPDGTTIQPGAMGSCMQRLDEIGLNYFKTQLVTILGLDDDSAVAIGPSLKAICDAAAKRIPQTAPDGSQIDPDVLLGRSFVVVIVPNDKPGKEAYPKQLFYPG